MNTESQPATFFVDVRARLLLSLCLLAAAAMTAPLAAKTITVDTTLDIADATPGDGDCGWAGGKECSLRAAVQEANAHVGFDEIVLPAGTYTFSLAPVFPGVSDADGDLEITDDLQVTGAGADVTVIDGDDLDGIFQVYAGTVVAISGVTIRNGSAGGGAGVWNWGDLELEDCVVSDNTTDNSGGAGIKNSSGAILTVDKCLINRNTTTNGSGGGILNQGTATISRSVIDGNTANLAGGGLFNDDFAETTVEYSTVSGNMANTDWQWWGGGGIMNVGTLTVKSSTISGNTAAQSDGGGIAILGGQVMLLNTTLSGNTAASEGGGLYGANSSGGGGATLLNCTVADNTASAGAGIYHNSAVNLDATIVADNIGGNCVASTDCVSWCHNLDSENSCGFVGPGDQVNTDPLLGPLADNGGATHTRALLAGSPAVDGGDPINGCIDLQATPLGADQRGFPRPADGDLDGAAVCDIGAFEYGSLPVLFFDGFESGDTSGWSWTEQ